MADKPIRVKILDGSSPVSSERMVEMTAEQVEQALLAQLAAAQDDPTEAMWELAQFYKLEGRFDRAMACFEALLQRVSSDAAKASIWLGLGQSAEQVGDFELAAVFYREGLALDATSEFTGYFLNNNLGFSLNQLRRHAEAEGFCRRAIEIDPTRQNAHKNLGLSLQGQGYCREAGQAFIAAIRANAADTRSLRHLEALLAQHAELAAEFSADLEAFRRALHLRQH